jgi:hypothetical protein
MIGAAAAVQAIFRGEHLFFAASPCPLRSLITRDPTGVHFVISDAVGDHATAHRVR